MTISLIMFTAIKYTVGFRVSEECEDSGLDIHEHGEASYIFDEFGVGIPSQKVLELVASKAHASFASQNDKQLSPTGTAIDQLTV